MNPILSLASTLDSTRSSLSLRFDCIELFWLFVIIVIPFVQITHTRTHTPTNNSNTLALEWVCSIVEFTVRTKSVEYDERVEGSGAEQ